MDGRLSLLLAALVAACAVGSADAGAARGGTVWQPPRLLPVVMRVLERDLARAAVAVDCTYAARQAEGFAQPAWRGFAPRIYLKQHVCDGANAAATTCRSRTCPAAEVGAALLVLVHEAMHVAGVTDETAAECAALDRVPSAAAALGVAPVHLAALIAGAHARHARLRAEHGAYRACPDEA
jgi:hypothetical protein